MAKTTFVNQPVDKPLQVNDQGLVQVERDFFAQEQQGRGFTAGLDGSTEIGRNKGNGARAAFPEPRVDCPVPFKLRGG